MIQTHIDGLSARIAKVAPDTDELLSQAGAQAERAVEERIRSTKFTRRGTAWAALAPATAKRKRGQGLLEETGRLVASIQSIARGDEVEIGSPLSYALPVAAGFRTRSGRLAPARHFLGLSAEDERVIEGLALATLEEALA